MNTAINILEQHIKELREKRDEVDRAADLAWVEAENLREQSAKWGAVITNCRAAINILEAASGTTEEESK